MFPKGNAYVDDTSCMNRMVVVEDLSPGNYTIEFVIPNSDGLFNALTKREVFVSPGKIIKIDQAIKPRYSGIKVVTKVAPEGEIFDIPPTVTLHDQSGQIHAQSTLGKFVNQHLLPGRYTLTFENLPGFQAPSPIELNLGPNEFVGPIEGIYVKGPEDPSERELSEADSPSKTSQETDEIQKTVLVQAGKLILGDPFKDSQQNELPQRIVKISGFYIGTYEVTNAQFAQWLNKAWSEGKIIFHSEPSKRGQITDLEGHLLFKTLESEPHSQIYTHTTSQGPHFLPMFGKHNFPVINVSWYGAQAYCKGYNFRLPTEAEWEKAAGMENTAPGEPLKKFRYGFKSDSIDKTWANYRDTDKRIENYQVLTTRVGFYNGINKLEKSAENPQELTTHLAQSPSGAYDMSGNVWEWVGDWYDDEYYKNMPEDNPQGPAQGVEKVAKGGCYDSLADGVRVAERIGLPPDHTDPYTGFRVAVDIQ